MSRPILFFAVVQGISAGNPLDSWVQGGNNTSEVVETVSQLQEAAYLFLSRLNEPR